MLFRGWDVCSFGSFSKGVSSLQARVGSQGKQPNRISSVCLSAPWPAGTELLAFLLFTSPCSVVVLWIGNTCSHFSATRPQSTLTELDLPKHSLEAQRSGLSSNWKRRVLIVKMRQNPALYSFWTPPPPLVFGLPVFSCASAATECGFRWDAEITVQLWKRKTRGTFFYNLDSCRSNWMFCSVFVLTSPERVAPPRARNTTGAVLNVPYPVFNHLWNRCVFYPLICLTSQLIGGEAMRWRCFYFRSRIFFFCSSLERRSPMLQAL